MSTLPNSPLNWLDKELGAAYSTVQSAGTSVAQETIVDFIGCGVVDDPIGGRTLVKVANELTMPVAGVYCPTGTSTLVAEVDLTLDSLGNVEIHGSIVGGSASGSVTSVEYTLGYGTSTPIDNTAMHKVQSTGDFNFGDVAAVVPGLNVGPIAYKFGFYVKPVGGSMLVVAKGGALNVREARR